MLDRIADHATLADVLAPHLELRLDERDNLAPRSEDTKRRRQNLFERDERDIDDGERRLVAEDARVERARIRVLHHDHALILAQTGVELAGADVDRVHTRGALLEQAIGEPARRGADVQTDSPGHLDLEVVERVDELLAPAAHVGAPRPDLDGGPWSDQDARLIH